ncbi:MAG: RDD family protein [Microthrixaceae bacterium]|nr:RDD family protein [Microthrixaceae bacterium]
MTQPTRGIVTPEAVLLEFQTASVPTRVLQFSLDVLVQFAGFVAAFLVLGAADAANLAIPEWVAIVFATVMFFLILLGYPILMETLWNGRTLGMAAAGLRVVTTEGAPIRFRHAAIRGALGLVDFWLIPVGVIATVVILLTRDNQRLGDLAAGTLVLRERSPVDRTAEAMAFFPPYGLEPYAAGLDVTSVSSEQYQVLRAYLLRVADFTPEARWSLGARLANPVATEMGHVPPANLAPETFLVCVAAAYQLRHGGPPGGWPAAAPAWGGPWWPTAGAVPARVGPPLVPGRPTGPSLAPVGDRRLAPRRRPPAAVTSSRRLPPARRRRWRRPRRRRHRPGRAMRASPPAAASSRPREVLLA